ncbi:hypothetical protein [Streptomyces lydicus]|uniref:Uncharacterized protein n=1 Tax=Streptomyces lydicus TaxID=47763 RepID=A0A1D7VQY9_9ACTN|nr:hypothetical protein [Streptomyces lydicus]AOP49190.1 hypothetical protein SL103_25725 [Streptomyces lydicus]
MVAGPRVVVIAAGEGVRSARAARLAAHYGVPRMPAVDVLLDRHALPADGYVVDSSPHLLDRVAGSGGLLPALAFADLVVLLRDAGWSGADETCRLLRYYEARGVLVGFPPQVADQEVIEAVDAALRGRTAPDPPAPPEPGEVCRAGPGPGGP